MLRVIRVAAIVSLAACFVGNAIGQTLSCKLSQQARETLEPSGDGPARLIEVFCHKPPSGYFSGTPIHVSPDGLALAKAFHPTDVRVVELTTPGWNRWSNQLAPTGIEHLDAPMRWDASGRVLWVALQDRAAFGGWAEGLTRLARLTAAGAEDLPPVDAAAGRLDRVRWIGDGLFLGQFDTRGQYYKPEQDNPHPSLGIVDAGSGRVLDRIEYDSLERLGVLSARIKIGNGFATAAMLPTGKVRIVLSPSDWVVWTEGEAPRTMTNPYKKGNQRNGSIALTPDGKFFLVSSLLRAGGQICEFPRSVDFVCPPAKPDEGVWAAVHDATTGDVLWKMMGRTVHMGGVFRAPEIRDDGQLALMALPNQGDSLGLGLISMKDGAILQRFRDAQDFGFSSDGRTMWIDRGGAFSRYALSN